MADDPLCVLLLTNPLERFILRDQAADLLRAQGVLAVEPPRVPYGALLRLPDGLAGGVASRQARRLRRTLRGKGRVKVVVMFHAVQYPLARALVAAEEGAELWYSRWDRYEEAYDATPAQRTRLGELHALAAQRSDYTFAVSQELVRIEEAAGRAAHLVPSAADSFPAPPLAPWTGDRPTDPVAISLGYLGWRTDWALLRDVVDALPDLTLHLVGEWQDGECGDDPAYRALREAPRVVWHGRQDDAAAAALIQQADVGIVPFTRTPFNDAGLPNRILKYARQGRRTVSPPLAGARTWANAVTFADGAEAFAAALREAAGARAEPDLALREWALAQTARSQDDPLWQRLAALGVDVRIA
jgi:hypothetical protein